NLSPTTSKPWRTRARELRGVSPSQLVPLNFNDLPSRPNSCPPVDGTWMAHDGTWGSPVVRGRNLIHCAFVIVTGKQVPVALHSHLQRGMRRTRLHCPEC